MLHNGQSRAATRQDTLLHTLTTSLARPSSDGKVTNMYNKVWVGGTKKVRRPQAESACVRAELTLTCDLDLRPGS